ncbi:MAG TPA: ROK family protein, partial [Coriobacteriia bacterium]|nr:ROK family protein [Coriobacteriia bacterium]
MIIGIETGGTKIVCAVGTSPTDMVEVVTFPTEEPETTLTAVARFVTKWRQSDGVEGLGIGSFGPVDLDHLSPTFGRIGASPKLAWRGADVVGPLAEAAGAPVAIETDVTAAAIGELRWGAGIGLTDLA